MFRLQHDVPHRSLYAYLIRLRLYTYDEILLTPQLAARIQWDEDLDVRQVEEGRSLKVRTRQLVKDVRGARILRQLMACLGVGVRGWG